MKNRVFSVIKIVILILICVLSFMPMFFIERFNFLSIVILFIILILLGIIYKKTIWLEIINRENIYIEDITLEILKRIECINTKTKVFVLSKEHLGNDGVFVYGIVKPKILISDTVYSRLNQKELDSIILHECYHILKNTELNYNFLRIISFMLSFMGLFFVLRENIVFSGFLITVSMIILRVATLYKLSDEFKADEFSVKNNNGEVLASALSKIQELMRNTADNNKLKLGIKTHPDLEDRINRINDINHKIKNKTNSI